MKPINLSLIATPGSNLTLSSCSKDKEAAPEKKHREKSYTGVRQGFSPICIRKSGGNRNKKRFYQENLNRTTTGTMLTIATGYPITSRASSSVDTSIITTSYECTIR